MDIQIILSIVCIVMLALVIVIVLVGRKKSDLGEVTSLLDRAKEEQRESVAQQVKDGITEQLNRFGIIQESLQSALQKNREELTHTLQTNREELTNTLQANRGELTNTLQTNREEANRQLSEFGNKVDARLSSMQHGNAENHEKINATIEGRLKALQESNENRLDQLRGVVDEKLQATLETRIAKSFELVSTQLDRVGQGLGEMKTLAADAKSLKNAFLNIKNRGTYGEVRLEKLLSDILTPSQYEKNVKIKSGTREAVEFAIKLPGHDDTPVLLPIDSKWPVEDYNRLFDAEDKEAIKGARAALAKTVLESARDIAKKYIDPPKTTDFALMFLPTEGLYAEVLQNAALFEEMRINLKVTAVGASTLSAFLGSLQIGFKTLAIERHSQEVWDTLGKAKKAFGTFQKVLMSAQDNLKKADNDIENLIGARTKAINKVLEKVEKFGGDEEASHPLLEFEEGGGEV
ncbi:MAG: DNA recombination protein RmuC [Deltaproteobacteria bacterium]|jgi:DNA recombination protein RmuC|nr:DNA recombination protein RmuC [Deltaproteobacteria bacterium]